MYTFFGIGDNLYNVLINQIGRTFSRLICLAIILIRLSGQFIRDSYINRTDGAAFETTFVQFQEVRGVGKVGEWNGSRVAGRGTCPRKVPMTLLGAGRAAAAAAAAAAI
jgi:hypothetical protein